MTILGTLRSNQQRLQERLEQDISTTVHTLASYLGRRYDHIEDDHGGQYEDPDLSGEKENCIIHHNMVMKCLRELVRGSVWRWDGSSGLGVIGLPGLIANIFGLAVPPSGSEQEQRSDCDHAQAVLRSYIEQVQRFKDQAEGSFAGCCLECFKGAESTNECDHSTPVADCPHKGQIWGDLYR